MSGTDDLLDEREETHGDYENTARIIQRFKRVMYSELMERELRGQDDLSDVARETMEMMLHKFGRIISGKWDHPDHWKDLCGYPALVVRSIEEAGEWVEYKSDDLREPDMEPDGYDWRADEIGGFHEDDPSDRRLVIIESPYAGDTENNVAYARRCVRDSLKRGEAPIASHLLYTQPGILNDDAPEERQNGIDTGLAWRFVADASVVYTDMGISRGMQYGIDAAKNAGVPIEYRSIGEDVKAGRRELPAMFRQGSDPGDETNF